MSPKLLFLGISAACCFGAKNFYNYMTISSFFPIEPNSYISAESIAKVLIAGKQSALMATIGCTLAAGGIFGLYFASDSSQQESNKVNPIKPSGETPKETTSELE